MVVLGEVRCGWDEDNVALRVRTGVLLSLVLDERGSGRLSPQPLHHPLHSTTPQRNRKRQIHTHTMAPPPLPLSCTANTPRPNSQLSSLASSAPSAAQWATCPSPPPLPHNPANLRSRQGSVPSLSTSLHLPPSPQEPANTTSRRRGRRRALRVRRASHPEQPELRVRDCPARVPAACGE